MIFSNVPASVVSFCRTFSARSASTCAVREVHLFTFPSCDSACLDFMRWLSRFNRDFSELFSAAFYADAPASSWLFCILTPDSFRVFGVGSIKSSIIFFDAFYRQFLGLDDFGFYDGYAPAPITYCVKSC